MYRASTGLAGGASVLTGVLMANATSPVLVQRPPLADIVTPFEGDLLERAAVAQRLTAYLQRLQIGAVMAIDAPWGEGKTWFGRHWAKSLENDGHRVAFVDAFGQDYAEDAFMVLAAGILKLCAGDATTAEKIKRGAGEVMRALLPAATKAVIHVAATAVGAGAVMGAINQAVDLDLDADEFASAAKQAGNKAGDVTSEWVKRRLGQWEAEQKSLERFRQILTEFARERFEETGKPVVIVVDELDRCRPVFAVALLERIKHFFEVPHLVFVLLMNRDQLEKAIRGVYGPETDAVAYLGKFLHLSLALPKATARYSDQTQQRRLAFVQSTLENLTLPDDTFARALAPCAAAFDLSLRDIERACSQYALSGQRAPMMKAYLIALKLKHPTLFRDIGRPVHDVRAHLACSEMLAAEVAAVKNASLERNTRNNERYPSSYFHALQLLHEYHLGKWADDERFANEGGRALSILLDDSPAFAFRNVLRELDLDAR